MAGVNNQYELIKMYLAAFNRAPEKTGLEYWQFQLESGKSFDSMLDTVFSLDVVTVIYPLDLPNQSFVTLIYNNVFGKAPDREGLAYWEQQMNNGLSRGNLVMYMINAGLGTPDGTLGKAYLVNRLAAAQFAVEQQFAQRADLTPEYLKSVMATVNADVATVEAAKKAVNPNVTGIGLGAPINSIAIAAAAGGISAAEVSAGVTVVIDLKGTNAQANNSIELLLNRNSFSTPVVKVLTDAEVKAQKVTMKIPNIVNWGSDGSKSISVYLKDSAGNVGQPGGDLSVELNAVAPNAPSKPVSVSVAANSINAAEKAAGVVVNVDLTGTQAATGDKLDILIGGQIFSPAASVILSEADIQAGFATVTISGAANWGADGDKNISARITDVSGNIGGIGGVLTVELDATAPSTISSPVIISAASGGIGVLERSNTIVANVNLGVSNAQAGDSIELLIDGKVFANSTLHVLTASEINDKSVSLTIAGGDLAWGSPEGDRTITARLVDQAGNPGNAGGSLKVTLDSTPPTSQNSSLTVAAATNALNLAEINAGVPVVVNLTNTGAVAGDLVSILLDGQALSPLVSMALTATDISAKFATIIIPSGANWGGDGIKGLSAMITDRAGNPGAPGNVLTVIVDKTAPAAVSNPIQIAAAANSINLAEKMAGVVVLVDLSGTGAKLNDKVDILNGGQVFSPGASVFLSEADIQAGFATVTISGAASWGGDGDKNLSARITDVSGNSSAFGGFLAVALDTTVPGAISSPVVISAASGGIGAIERSNTIVVNVSLGTSNAQVGDSIELLVDGKVFANSTLHVLSASEISDKSVSLTIAGGDLAWGSADGDRTITARLVDQAGNPGNAGGSLKVTLDSTSPNSQNATLTVAAATNGLNLAETTAGVSVVVGLTNTGAVAGDVVTILLDGQALTPAVSLALSATDISAKFATITIPSTVNWQGDGVKELSAMITDRAGNVGASSNALSVLVDRTAPLAVSSPIQITAAANSINLAEKMAGVVVRVDLSGTGAKLNDKVDILNGGQVFSPGASVLLSEADILAGFATVTISGAASWGSDGDKNLTARITDVSGNASGVGGLLAIALDTTLPGTISSPLVISAASGGIGAVERSNTIVVNVSLGTSNAQAGDSVELLIDGKVFANSTLHELTSTEISTKSVSMTIAGGDLAWGSADGDRTITARLVDQAGNPGIAGGSLKVTLDSTPPNSQNSTLTVAAATNGLNLAEITAGVSVVVNLTNTGAVAGDVVTILLDGLALTPAVSMSLSSTDVAAKFATIVIPSTVNWQGDGVKALSAMITDKAGNTGAPGDILSVLVDKTAPSASSNPIQIAAAANSINLAEKTAGVVVLVDLAGTGANINDKVEIMRDSAAFTAPVVQFLSSTDIANGFAYITIPQTAGWGSDGNKNLGARIIDNAGNVGVVGPILTVNLDTLAPTKPLSSLVVPANSGGGITAAEREAGVELRLDLNGSNVVAGDVVEILIGGSPFSQAVLHTLTEDEISTKLALLSIATDAGWGIDGSKVLTARFIDSAGNVGVAGSSVTVLLDGTAPNTPTGILKVAAATNGINNSEKVAGVSVLVDLNGTGAVAGDKVHLQIDGLAFASPVSQVLTAANVTAKSVTIVIPSGAGWGSDGVKLITANVVDTFGNVGAIGGNVNVTLDTAAPTSPSNPIAVPVATNSINSQEKTAGVSVNVDLLGSTAVAGDTLEILIAGLPFATPVRQVLTAADIENGQASLTIASTAGWGSDGSKTLSVRLTDVAGNVGTAGAALTIDLDTVAPAGPSTVLQVAANAGGGITLTEKNAGVVVTVGLNGVTALAGDLLEIMIDGAKFATPVIHTLTAAELTAKSANITILSNSGWGSDGTHSLSARFIDSAGNIGSATGSVSIKLIDSTPPGLPLTSLVVNAAANGINAAEKSAGVLVQASLSGTGAEAGDVASLFIDGAAFVTPITHVITAGEITSGSFNFTIASGAGWGTDGTHLLNMGITDVAGNIGLVGGDLSVILDTIAPGLPFNAVQVSVANNGINAEEKAAGVVVTIDLAGTNAVENDKIELMLGGASFTLPIVHILTAAEILAGSANITISPGAGWGSDGVKTIAARGIDVAGNIGAIGGSLTTFLDTTIPAAVGLPVYTDVDASGTVNVGDTFLFSVSVETNKAITITDIEVDHSHTFGLGASTSWSVDGTQLLLTLGAGSTVVAGDTVTLIGVSDIAGNSLNLAFTI